MNNINEQHRHEWVIGSGVDPEIVALNVRSLLTFHGISGSRATFENQSPTNKSRYTDKDLLVLERKTDVGEKLRFRLSYKV